MSRRLFVDAMNVIGSSADRWWNDPDGAMRTMTERLDAYAGETGEDVTVVLDKDPGSLPRVDNVDVVIARRRGRNAADYEIEQMVARDDDPSTITVVTSDKRLVEKVRSLGARTTGAGAFRKRLDAGGR
jgi:predicted RNA-binding protein with PIN domain